MKLDGDQHNTGTRVGNRRPAYVTALGGLLVFYGIVNLVSTGITLHTHAGHPMLGVARGVLLTTAGVVLLRERQSRRSLVIVLFTCAAIVALDGVLGVIVIRGSAQVSKVVTAHAYGAIAFMAAGFYQARKKGGKDRAHVVDLGRGGAPDHMGGAGGDDRAGRR